MKFWYENVEYDTDTQYYVAGYKIDKSWFLYNEDSDLLKIKEYGLLSKKATIASVSFDYNQGQSYVNGVTLTCDISRYIDQRISVSDVIMGTSVTDVKRKVESLLDEPVLTCKAAAERNFEQWLTAQQRRNGY